MTYNTRFEANFKDMFGFEYKVEIKEQNYAGLVTELNPGPEGFRLTYSGTNKTIQNYILGSKVEMELFITTDDEKMFIHDLAVSDDQHFLMSITRDKGTGFENFWVGYVLADLVNFDDAPYPFVFKIVAADCFATLRNIDYTNSVWDADGEPSDVVQNMNELIHETIELSGLTDHFVNSFWLTYVNELPYLPTNYNSSLANKLRVIGINTNAFVKYDTSTEGVEYVYTNCYDVLETMCKLMNARMFQWEGLIWFVPYYIYESGVASYDFTRSDKSGVGSLSYGTINLFSDEADYNRFVGGVFDFLPAVKEVCVQQTYHYDPLLADTVNALPCGSTQAPIIHDLVYGFDLTSFDGYNGSADVDVNLDFRYNLIWSGATLPNPPNNYKLVMKFRINSGQYYLINDIDTNYTPSTDLTFTDGVWKQNGERTYTEFTAGQTVIDISDMSCLDLPDNGTLLNVYKNGELIAGTNYVYSKAALTLTMITPLALGDVITIAIDYSNETFSIDVTDSFDVTTAGLIIYESNQIVDTNTSVVIPIKDVPTQGLTIQHTKMQPYDVLDPNSPDYYNSDFYLKPRSDEVGTYSSIHVLYQHPFLGVSSPGGDISTMHFSMTDVVPVGSYTAQPSNSTDTIKTCVMNATNSSETTTINLIIGGTTTFESDAQILFRELGESEWQKAIEWNFTTETGITHTGTMNECIAKLNAELTSKPMLKYQGRIQRDSNADAFHPVRGLQLTSFGTFPQGSFFSSGSFVAAEAEWSIQLLQL